MKIKIALILTVLTLFFATVAYADTRTWEFNFSTGGATVSTGPEEKSDSTNTAAFTLLNNCASHSFVPNSHALGARVRRYDDSAQMTDYYVYHTTTVGSKMSYTQSAYQDTEYFLRMQSDSSGLQTSFRTNGRWAP